MGCGLLLGRGSTYAIHLSFFGIGLILTAITADSKKIAESVRPPSGLTRGWIATKPKKVVF